MNLSDLIKQLFNAATIFLIGLTQTGVYSRPTDHSSKSSVDSSIDTLSMDYRDSTTPKIEKLHSRDIALGELISKSVAEDNLPATTQKRYRRLCKYYQYNQHLNIIVVGVVYQQSLL